MKNMINLLKLNYTSILALRKSALVMLVLVIFIVLLNKDGSTLPLGGALLIMFLNYSTLAYEDKSKMNYLVYSLPVKPKDYILSKYVYGIINIVLSIWFADIMYIVLKVFNMMPQESIPVGVINISLGIIGFIMVSIVAPIALVVGFNKARLILVFLAIIPACFSNVIVNTVSQMPDILSAFSFESIEIIILAIGLIFTVLSYFICSGLYSKKDIN